MTLIKEFIKYVIFVNFTEIAGTGVPLITYADKKVNKPASRPTAKHGHSNNGKNMAGNSNNKKGNTTAKPNDNNRHIAQNTNKNSGSGHFGGRR